MMPREVCGHECAGNLLSENGLLPRQMTLALQILLEVMPSISSITI